MVLRGGDGRGLERDGWNGGGRGERVRVSAYGNGGVAGMGARGDKGRRKIVKSINSAAWRVMESVAVFIDVYLFVLY